MSNEEKILQMLTEMRSEMDARFTKLETDVSGLKATQAEMQETLTRVAVTQENIVLPRIQLLFEGHSELRRQLDTLATKEQAEELADDVDIIKDVVSRHSVDIGKLKKAQ